MISDNIARDIEALRIWLAAEENLKIRAGIRVARLEKRYGDGTVETIAQDAGYSDKTLYARQNVSVFLVAWCSAMPEHNIFSVRRFFDEHPGINYTHIRIAVPSERKKWDFEQAIEALLAVENGDPAWDAYEARHHRTVSLPMPTETFGRYLTWLRGGTPSSPIFRKRGHLLWIIKEDRKSVV